MNSARKDFLFWAAIAASFAYAVQPSPTSRLLRSENEQYNRLESIKREERHKTDMAIARAKALRDAGVTGEEFAATNKDY